MANRVLKERVLHGERPYIAEHVVTNCKPAVYVLASDGICCYYWLGRPRCVMGLSVFKTTVM